MKSKFFGVLYALNIVAQAIFTLATPALLFFGISFLFIKHADAPQWIYAITIPVGIIIGFYNMVRFVLTATTALERLEKQSKKTKKDSNDKGKTSNE